MARESGVLALVFRHLEPLSVGDLEKLTDFAKREAVAVFLQPGGIDSVSPLWPEHVDLHFDLGGQKPGLDTSNIDVNARLATVG